jgi:two-component system sensor kinase FixL
MTLLTISRRPFTLVDTFACDEDPSGHLGASADVAASRQALQALYQAQAQLADVTRVTSLVEMAASIAHELNQPLAAIRASSEACQRWLDRSEPDMDEARASLSRITQSAARASDVISRVRALSRRSDPQHRPESFNAIVHETLSFVQYEIARHEIEPTVRLTIEKSSIEGDRVQLQQVVVNLLLNACQAMQDLSQETRKLSITTSFDEAEAVLEISDSGIGIADDVMPSLFTPFFTTKTDGLGMGLSICRSIIESHGGRIWASSVPGKGTSFFVALPLIAG